MYHSLDKNTKALWALQQCAALLEVSSGISPRFQSPFGAVTPSETPEKGTRSLLQGTPAPHIGVTVQGISEGGIRWGFCRAPEEEAPLDSLVGLQTRRSLLSREHLNEAKAAQSTEGSRALHLQTGQILRVPREDLASGPLAWATPGRPPYPDPGNPVPARFLSGRTLFEASHQSFPGLRTSISPIGQSANG